MFRKICSSVLVLQLSFFSSVSRPAFAEGDVDPLEQGKAIVSRLLKKEGWTAEVKEIKDGRSTHVLVTPLRSVDTGGLVYGTKVIQGDGGVAKLQLSILEHRDATVPLAEVGFAFKKGESDEAEAHRLHLTLRDLADQVRNAQARNQAGGGRALASTDRTRAIVELSVGIALLGVGCGAIVGGHIVAIKKKSIALALASEVFGVVVFFVGGHLAIQGDRAMKGLPEQSIFVKPQN